MVAHEDEEGVVEEGVAVGVLDETTQCEIGVPHGVHAALLGGVGADAARRIQERAVVRDREDDRVERRSRGVDRVHFGERPVEDRLVAHAPGRTERLLREVALLDDALDPVRLHVAAHPVEERASSVDEEGTVAARFQDLGQRKESPGALPADDRDSRERGERCGRGLERPDRAVPGRVRAGQERSLRDERVQGRGQALPHLGVERPHELGAEALLEHEDDVRPARLPERADVAQRRARSEGRSVRGPLGQQPMEPPEVGVRRIRPIQPFVRRILTRERLPERAVSVVRDPVDRTVGGDAGQAAR